MEKDPRDVIIRPVITEHSYDAMENNVYTFEVAKDANKVEIRQAIEAIFNVKVVKVNTLNVKSKPKRVRMQPGRTRTWKKAMVTLKDGDTIHIENLPYGVEYKVSETPVADYMTTETGTEGEVDEAVEQANFTNTKGGTVDAGVVLDSAPYLFTLTGAAGIGLLLTLRRRHQK